MTIEEMERKLQEDDMFEIHFDGVIKKYIKGEDVYYDDVFHNCVDVFGIYKTSNNKYRFFVTESERGGIPLTGRVYDTEEEACEELIDFMYTEEELYQDNNN